jgi:SPW repeat-containing protein
MMRLRTLQKRVRLPLAAGAVMLWVAVGPWVWGFAGSRSAVADHVFLVFAFGPLALLIAALRPAAFATLAAAVWIVLSPWMLGYATTHAAWANELITGLLLIVLCLKAAGLAPIPFMGLGREARTRSGLRGAVKRVSSGS